MNGFEVLVEGQETAPALVPHFQDDVGLTNSPLGRDDESLTLKYMPIPGNLVVSAYNVPGIQTTAGVDSHTTLLLGGHYTSIFTYVNTDV